jgi:cation diffusion facilitator family transporter
MAAAPAHSRSSVVVSIASDITIAIFKVIVAAITGSSAMISEAIHSSVDSFNSIFLLVGERASRRPPDREHPFGHGKEIYFWTLMVAVSIFAGGGGVSIYEGFIHLIHPRPVDHSPWSYIVLGVAAVCETWATVTAYREYRREKRQGFGLWSSFRASKDLTTFAVLFENGAAVLGVFVAFAGIFATRQTGSSSFDAASSIVIGVMLAAVAFVLIRESKGLLIGESINPVAAEQIRGIVSATTDVEEVLNLMTMQTGARDVLLLMDVRFRAEMTATRMVEVIDALERLVRNRYPDISRIFIEADRIVEQRMP